MAGTNACPRVSFRSRLTALPQVPLDSILGVEMIAKARRSLKFLLGNLLLSGCVSAPLLESQLGPFQGKAKNEVIQALGTPTSTRTDRNGLEVLVYGERGLFKRPDCVANFHIEGGYVKRWSWSGRRCQTIAEEGLLERK
ncbi:MAG: hypothetical protein AAF542_25535 [Pseudomonadota bacterium]